VLVVAIDPTGAAMGLVAARYGLRAAGVFDITNSGPVVCAGYLARVRSWRRTQSICGCYGITPAASITL
jgi:hypothetical protein